MNNLSTGDPSTLGSYLKLCSLCFGEKSKSAAFFQGKIVASEKGEFEEVLTDESQMMHVIASLEK